MVQDILNVQSFEIEKNLGVYIHTCARACLCVCVCVDGGGGGWKITWTFECCIVNLPYMSDSFWSIASFSARSKSIVLEYFTWSINALLFHITQTFLFQASWFDTCFMSVAFCSNRFTVIRLLLCLLWYLLARVGLLWWWNVSLTFFTPCFYTRRTIWIVPVI
jgi:hypothetical protein